MHYRIILTNLVIGMALSQAAQASVELKRNPRIHWVSFSSNHFGHESGQVTVNRPFVGFELPVGGKWTTRAWQKDHNHYIPTEEWYRHEDHQNEKTTIVMATPVAVHSDRPIAIECIHPGINEFNIDFVIGEVTGVQPFPWMQRQDIVDSTLSLERWNQRNMTITKAAAPIGTADKGRVAIHRALDINGESIERILVFQPSDRNDYEFEVNELARPYTQSSYEHRYNRERRSALNNKLDKALREHPDLSAAQLNELLLDAIASSPFSWKHSAGDGHWYLNIQQTLANMLSDLH